MPPRPRTVEPRRKSKHEAPRVPQPHENPEHVLYRCHCIDGYPFWQILANGQIQCVRCGQRYMIPIERLADGSVRVAQPATFNRFRENLGAENYAPGYRAIISPKLDQKIDFGGNKK